MKKVLFINDMIFGGGVEKVLYDIVNYLKKEEYDVTIFTSCKEKNFHELYQEHVKHIYCYPFALLKKNRKSILSRIIRKILRILVLNSISRKRFDVVVAIKEGESMKLAADVKNVSKKLAWIHTDYNEFHWTKGLFGNEVNEYECMRKFNKIVCVSSAAMSSVINKVGNPGNLVVRYNPLNIEKIRDKSFEPCTEERKKDTILFVTVGRLAKQKGYTQLLKVMANIKRNLDFQLWIIGDGDETYKSEMKKIIKEENLEDNIIMFGNKKNPYPYIKEADWFVCSSEWESFCLVIQEALILGVPVVTTNCPGACELIDDKYSIVVENMEQMEEKLIQIIKNPLLSQQYKSSVSNYYHPVEAEKRLRDIEELF